MIPFPSGSVDSFANLLSVPQNLLNASLLSANGLNIQSLTGQPSGLHFAGHPSPMRNLCMGLAVPIINAASVIPVANLGVGVLPSVPYGSAGCLNPLMYYHAAVGHTDQSSIPSHNTGPPDSAAHTIVRGPVLYKSAANQETISTKAKEESPPDRIVASYAAAAHAAALACHQPISRAAEAYLATTCCNSRSRHSSKRSRTVNHLTTTSTLLTTSTTTTTTSTGNNRSNFNYATSLASLALLPSTTTSFIPSETNSVESHKGWTRKVDRKANTVVYISSDGIHMHNVDDVYAYLSAKYPSECLNNPNVKEMIATQFIFTPTNNNNNNNNATIHSLTDTIKFVHSLQVSALKNNAKQDDDDDNSTVSRLNTTHSPSKSSTTISNSVHNSSPEKTSSICRINFNPDHHSANNGSSPAKRSKLSDTSCVIINGESNELSSVSFSSSSDAYTVCSTQSSISSNPIECSVKQDLSNVSNTVVDTLTRDRGGACIQSSDLDSDQCCSNSETVSTLSANTTYTNDNISNRTSQNNIVQNGNNNNNIIAKLTTETLTTGALRNSMPSFTTEIVPSVFSSPLNKPMEHQIGTDLTNLLTDPCQLNFSTGSSNALQQQQQQQLASMMNHPLLLEQILAINRLAHIQQQHQQQQVNTTQLTTATQNTIEGGNSLGSQQSLSPTNPILSSLTNSWISSASNLQPTTTRITSLQELAMNNNPAVNSLSAVLQQHQQVQQQHQQLLALAALQQQHQQHQHQQQQQHQQAQFLAVLQAAALLQQQQQHQQQSGNSPNNSLASVLALRQQQQQQQQLAVAAVQAQTYLAAALQQQQQQNQQH